MKLTPNFYRDRVCLNVLAGSKANASAIYEAAEGHVLVGVLSAATISSSLDARARSSLEAKAKWGKMIERYLQKSPMLKLVFLLVDIRHEPSANDKMMYDWVVSNGYHPVIIATKLDKLKRSQVPKAVKTIRTGLGMEKEDILIPFSAETKQGREEIWELIESVALGTEE